MKYRVATIFYNNASEVADIVFSDWFKNLQENVIKVDILQDICADAENAYKEHYGKCFK